MNGKIDMDKKLSDTLLLAIKYIENEKSINIYNNITFNIRMC